ncbi:MAG: response regulator [Ktedonobacterales bacterium]
MISPRVLIVDDDTDILDVLDMLFTDDGFSTICCGTSEAARAALAVNQIQLFITDLRLVGSTGLDLVAQVRTLHGTGPGVIVLTAVQPAHAASELAQITQLGAHVITKPFDIDDLLNTARRLTGWPGRPLS